MRPAALGVVAGLGLLGTACCPIPLKRQVSVRPQLTIEVVDAAGDPVEGAPLLVRRYVAAPGPQDETDRWTARTGPGGKVTLAAIEASETYMPLMMHGVLWYGWEACATLESGEVCARHDARGPIEPPATIRITCP